MALTMLAPGRRAKVTALDGGREFKQRLASMGILPGSELLLLRRGTGGPLIVEVRGSQFIIGQGMAQRVSVKCLP